MFDSVTYLQRLNVTARQLPQTHFCGYGTFETNVYQKIIFKGFSLVYFNNDIKCILNVRKQGMSPKA